jgi:hypothetical protein
MDIKSNTLTAMADLRSGKITADEYRAIMRRQRETTSEADRNKGLLSAFAVDYAKR